MRGKNEKQQRQTKIRKTKGRRLRHRIHHPSHTPSFYDDLSPLPLTLPAPPCFTALLRTAAVQPRQTTESPALNSPQKRREVPSSRRDCPLPHRRMAGNAAAPPPLPRRRQRRRWRLRGPSRSAPSTCRGTCCWPSTSSNPASPPPAVTSTAVVGTRAASCSPPAACRAA